MLPAIPICYVLSYGGVTWADYAGLPGSSGLCKAYAPLHEHMADDGWGTDFLRHYHSAAARSGTEFRHQKWTLRDRYCDQVLMLELWFNRQGMKVHFDAIFYGLFLIPFLIGVAVFFVWHPSRRLVR